MDRISFRRSNILLGDRHTHLFQRLVAKGIDLLIAVAIYYLGCAIWGPLGVFGAVACCALQDGWGVGQSVGKRIIGLRVIEDQTGLPCSFKSSAVRNLPFMAALLFASTPVLWVFFLLIAAPLILVEIYLLISVESGIRLGDVLGNTLVVEYLETLQPSQSESALS